MSSMTAGGATLLREPLAELQSTFDAMAAAGSEALHTGAGVSVAAPLQAALSSPDASRAVPSLNVLRHDQIPPGALVRFCGMVQDVHDPEFFVGAYEEVAPDGATRLRTGKYRDALEPQSNCTVRPRDDCTWQRTPVVCVPIPTQTEWAARAIAGSGDATAPAGGPATRKAAKRGAGDDAEGAEMEVEADAESAAAAAAAAKKTRPEDGGAVQAAAERCAPCGEPHNGVEPAGGAAHADPWSRARKGSYLVKLYDQPDESELKVNDVVEVFGVLEVDAEPETAEASVPVGASGVEFAAAEERALRPPPSAQPRLHCIVFRKLPAQHHPLLPPPDAREEQAALAAARAQLSGVRPVLLAALASALGGDALAAEFALLSCISRVIGRHGDAALGKLHLNISGCPPAPAGAAASPAAASLHALLAQLLPLCGALPLSTDALNKTAYVPVKDHDANVLRTGALQLPLGATLLLDEAMMAAGKLETRGVANLRALATLLDTQKVGFDFTYFSVDIAADLTLLALSSGKTVLPIACRVPLVVEPAAAPMPAQLQQPAWLEAARLYLGLAARACPQTSIPEALTGAMQDDFVASRRAAPEIGADDFARWLTCTRLLAGSLLEGEVSGEHYARAKQLEAARCERLKKSSVGV